MGLGVSRSGAEAVLGLAALPLPVAGAGQAAFPCGAEGWEGSAPEGGGLEQKDPIHMERSEDGLGDAQQKGSKCDSKQRWIEWIQEFPIEHKGKKTQQA